MASRSDLRLLTAFCGMTIAAWGAGTGYKEHFEKASAWRATTPAQLSSHGRSGSALKISTYVKGGKDARWTSPKIAVEPGEWAVSAWTADNLAYTQDSGYGGMLAAVLYAGGGKEIKRVELVKVHKRPYRGFSDHYHIPAKGGLDWRYSEVGLGVPKNVTTLQLVFTWSEFTAGWRQTEGNIFGEAYLDDVTVTRGRPRKDLSAAVAEKAPLPYRLRINTPVYANTFLKQDPLEFTVRLDGDDGPPLVKRGMKLRYRVEDFQRLLIDDGEVRLAQPYYYWRKSPKAKEESLVKTFYLGDDVRQQIGKWMAVRVELLDGRKKLAEGENAFLITNPRILTPKQAERSHFWGDHLEPQPNRWSGTNPWGLGPSVRYNQVQKKGAFGLRSQGWDTRWRTRQPTKDSAIDFSGDHPSKDYPIHSASRETFAFSERNSLWYHVMLYTQIPKGVPDWAVLPGKKRTDDDFIDPEAYAKYVEQYVRHTRAMTYLVIGQEGRDLKHFPELAKAAYAAVKRVDRRLKVMCQVDFMEGRAYAKQLCDSGLIDYVDVLVFDNYTCRLGASCREFRQYAEEHGKYKQYWIPEYSYTGAYDQEERTRRIPDFCLWALANGVDKLRWYLNWNPTPHVRAPISGGWGQTGILDGQDEKLSPGATVLPGVAYNRNYSRGNLFPFLQEAMLYNLYQNFAIEEFRAVLNWDKDTEGVLFDGEGYSTACVWRKPGQPRVNLIVDSGGTPFEMIDMYGRRGRVQPTGGKAAITIGQNPLMFRFDGVVPSLEASKADFTVTKSQSAVAPGGSVRVTVELVNTFGRSWAGDICPEVGSTWRVIPQRRPAAMAPDQAIRAEFTLIAPRDAAPGDYPLIVSLDSAVGKAGVLYDEIRVGPPVELMLSERPYTRRTPGALIATVRTGTSRLIRGVVEAQGDLGRASAAAGGGS